MTRTGTPRARLLLTGDELLRGFIQDANSGFIAEQLRERGVELEQVRIIADDLDTIRTQLAIALDEDGIDLVITTGGLGPTHDDRTSEAVAGALGVELVLYEDALAIVEARVRAYGRMRTPEEVATFTPGNRKQATLPAGATWLDPLGTAPGYVVSRADGAALLVLPGPPSELRHAWAVAMSSDEIGAILARVGDRHERLLRVWGVPESRASQALAATGHEDGPARRVTICARDGELEIALRGSDVAGVDTLTDQLHAALAEQVFAVDDDRSVTELVAAGLRERGWMLATAESCTGGMLGATVTSLAGSSAWYAGGLVTYANEVKVALAGVTQETLDTVGAVSEDVARQLASGARDACGAQVGIGITGIAGPGGGSDEKPVGTVHIGIVTPETQLHRVVRIPGNRATVRRRSCTIALHALRELLEG